MGQYQSIGIGVNLPGTREHQWIFFSHATQFEICLAIRGSVDFSSDIANHVFTLYIDISC